MTMMMTMMMMMMMMIIMMVSDDDGDGDGDDGDDDDLDGNGDGICAGVITLQEEHTVCKKGEKLTPEKGRILVSHASYRQMLTLF